MQDQLRQLIHKHCATLRERTGELSQAIAALSPDMHEPAQVLRESREIAHQIAGASGSIGFPFVSATAQTLERHLESIMETGVPPTAPEVAETNFLLEALQKAAEQAAPESSTLYNADLSQVTAARTPGAEKGC